jgi:hypothetical protein
MKPSWIGDLSVEALVDALPVGVEVDVAVDEVLEPLEPVCDPPEELTEPPPTVPPLEVDPLVPAEVDPAPELGPVPTGAADDPPATAVEPPPGRPRLSPEELTCSEPIGTRLPQPHNRTDASSGIATASEPRRTGDTSTLRTGHH